MIANEVHRFKAANGIKMSINDLTNLLLKNDAQILDTLFQVAKKDGTLADFDKATQEAVSKMLSPYIPPQRSN